VAARHLFRHLHDPRSLRKNPLVRRFFADATIGKLNGALESEVLARIHELVRRGADHCRDSDIAAGKDERALRQHTIIALQCLGQRPIRQVAATLGISYHHCYRLRADICRRIARYVNEQNDTRVALDHLPEVDGWELLVSQTLRRAAIYDEAAAFRAGGELVRAAQSAQQRIVALCAVVSIAIDFGNLEPAKEANSAARALCNEHSPQNPSASWKAAQSRLDVTGAQLAYMEGQKLQHLRLAEKSALRLEPIQLSAPAHVRELYTESLYELGTGFWNLGELERGIDYDDAAERSLRNAPTTSFLLRARVMLTLWSRRNFLLMASKTWYPSRQRLDGLSTAFEQAYASGALLEAKDALVAIAQYHAFAGNGDETLRAGRFAISLAKQQHSERMLAQVEIQVATMLQWTRYSGQAHSFLPVTLSACDAYHRELASYFEAKRALLSHRYQDAWSLATAACERNKYFTLTVRQQTVAAAAAGRLGRRREAHAMIDRAVSAAEKLGSAAVLRDAYLAAADIREEARFRRKAGELNSLLVT